MAKPRGRRPGPSSHKYSARTGNKTRGSIGRNSGPLLTIPGARRLQKQIMDSYTREMEHDELIAALESSHDERLLKLRAMMLNPELMRSTPFGEICHKAGIGIVELVEACKRYHIDVGIIRIARRMPEILWEIATDSLPGQDVCSRCDGTGEIEDVRAMAQLAASNSGSDDGSPIPVIYRQCPYCAGQGRIRAPASPHARTLLMETLGLTGKRAPIVMPVTIHNPPSTPHAVLIEAQTIIEGEVVNGDNERSEPAERGHPPDPAEPGDDSGGPGAG